MEPQSNDTKQTEIETTIQQSLSNDLPILETLITETITSSSALDSGEKQSIATTTETVAVVETTNELVEIKSEEIQDAPQDIVHEIVDINSVENKQLTLEPENNEMTGELYKLT